MDTFTIIILSLFCVYITNYSLMLIVFGLSLKSSEIKSNWMTFCLIFPILGILIYFIYGGSLSNKVKKEITKKNNISKNICLACNGGSFDISEHMDKYADVVVLGKNQQSLGLNECNVKIYEQAIDSLKQLKISLLNAKKHINIQTFMLEDDDVGNDIINILTKKAIEGVKVKLLIDGVGSKVKDSFFKLYIKSGGEVARFFPSMFGLSFLNTKLNYRNHRKIIIIDGELAYMGGFNFKNDHFNMDKNLYPFKDTNIKITGKLVDNLQMIFLSDWYYVTKKKLDKDLSIYFSKHIKGESFGQIVATGPNDSSRHEIKEMYLKLIGIAKKHIVLQTPYFVPSNEVFEVLKVALMSGVKVDIMVPYKADKILSHGVTMYYCYLLCKYGANIHLYKNFIHSKTLFVDDKFLSIGSCNFDMRSFNLNFEVNAFFYDEIVGNIFKNIYNIDVSTCENLDRHEFLSRYKISKLKQAFFRLISPLI